MAGNTTRTAAGVWDNNTDQKRELQVFGGNNPGRVVASAEPGQTGVTYSEILNKDEYIKDVSVR